MLVYSSAADLVWESKMPSLSSSPASASWWRHLRVPVVVLGMLALVAAGMIVVPAVPAPAAGATSARDIPVLPQFQGSLINKPAPELEGGTAWLNSSGPPRLADAGAHRPRGRRSLRRKRGRTI